MAEDLQNLLERLHGEAVKKADDEKNKIISDAKAQAEKILADAKAESETLRKKAAEDASASEAKAKSAVQQAARDIVLSLKASIDERLKNLVKGAVAQAMTPDVIGKIVLEMAKSYAAKVQTGAEPTLDLLVSAKEADELEKLFKSALVNSFKTKPQIAVSHDFAAGVQVGFKGSDLFFDFSDEAVTEVICQFVGPRLAALLGDAK